MGIDGIEAYHSKAKPQQARKLEELAQKNRLIVTAGSDFHGQARPERKLGRTTTKGKKIQDRFLEELCADN